MHQVTVSYDPQTGAIGVQAPTDNIIALGMLSLAQSYIYSRMKWGEPNTNKIIPFNGPIPPIKSQ